jgi:hypothetical protein
MLKARPLWIEGLDGIGQEFEFVFGEYGQPFRAAITPNFLNQVPSTFGCAVDDGCNVANCR